MGDVDLCDLRARIIGDSFGYIERGIFTAHVVRAHFAFRDDASNGGFQMRSHFGFLEPVEHQLGGQEHRDRVNLVLAGVFRRRAVCRFKHGVVVAEIRAGREAESADKTCAQIADDVAEHVFRYQHRVILRILEHPHADGVDVRVVGANVGIIFGHVAETTHHQTAGLAQHIWFLDQRNAFAPGLFGEFERLFANVGATLFAHDARGKRDVFQVCLVFPFFHLRVRAQRCVNRFRQREKLDAAVHAFGIFTEHNLVDRDIFSARISDLAAAIIQRVAGVTFARPHVGVEVEHLSQPDNRRKVNEPFVFQLRRQFFFRFRLRFAGDRAEETAGGLLERLHGAIRKRVAFLAPKLPADVAGHILGVEFQAIEREARRLHDIMPDSVPGHPRNFVFSHRTPTLSATVAARKQALTFLGRSRIIRLRRGSGAAGPDSAN
jgi:hypothetical protein